MGITDQTALDSDANFPSRCNMLLLARTMKPVERRKLWAAVSNPTTPHVAIHALVKGMGYDELGLSSVGRHRTAMCKCPPEALDPKHLDDYDKAEKADREARAKLTYEDGAAARSTAGKLSPHGNGGKHRDAHSSRKHDHHPSGWSPAVTYANGHADEFIAPPTETPIDDPDSVGELVASLGGPALPSGWRWTLAETRFDSVAWTRENQGEDAVTRPAWRHRFKAIEAPAVLSPIDMTELVDIARARKVAPILNTDTGSTLVVGLADWQAGQADGDGLVGLVGRLDQIPAQVRNELNRLKKAGTPADSILFAAVGDLLEGCEGWYKSQAATVQAHRRGQMNIVRRALTTIISDAATLGLPVAVLCVGGNHGEHRKDGKSFMGDGDNDDVAVFEAVSDAFRLAGDKYNHVTFHIPDDALSATLNVKGTIVGVTHGHLAGNGATPEKKIENWMKGQSLARTKVGDADLLITGHYHTWRIGDLNGIRWVQLPALCDTSKHFEERYGLVSTGPALLTFTVNENGADNWRMHQVKYLDLIPDGMDESMSLKADIL